MSAGELFEPSVDELLEPSMEELLEPSVDEFWSFEARADAAPLGKLASTAKELLMQITTIAGNARPATRFFGMFFLA
ncbi:MAG TPA: hypothetical protein V6C89_17695 [Drouetiella sp.]|jgi:hypothetical protein